MSGDELDICFVCCAQPMNYFNSLYVEGQNERTQLNTDESGDVTVSAETLSGPADGEYNHSDSE